MWRGDVAAWATKLLLVVGVGCVDVDLRELPCPCAEGYVCRDERCARASDGGSDARPEGDASGSSPDASRASPDASNDTSTDAEMDRVTPLEWRFESGSFDLRASPECVDSARALRIGSGNACTFVSPVVDAGRVVRLRQLRWLPRGPYAKPLPAAGVVESYARDGADMRGAVVVLRMDEATTMPVGDALRDASGTHECVVRGNAAAEPVEGPIGPAMVLGRQTRCELAAGRDPALQLGSSDFTWATWFRTTEPAEATLENRMLIGGEGSEPPDPHVWFGVDEACNGETPGATLGGSMRSAAGGDTTSYCGTTVVNDGNWHFGALAKRGHSVATLDVYTDGVREGRAEGLFRGPLSFRDEDDVWNLTSFRGGGFETTMALSNFAIWTRALSDAELRALHRRVALRFRVQLRVCESESCEGDLFDGPEGSDAFSDPPSNEGGLVEHTLDSVGRYFQVRAFLESDVVGESPEIEWIELVGSEP